MANQKLKLFFLALALLMQNAVAAPRALTGGEKFVAPVQVEILSRAFTEIAKSFSEFYKSVGQIINYEVGKGAQNLGLPIFVKWHLMLAAAGVQDTGLTLTKEQHLEHRVVASTVLQLRQNLEFMNQFEEVFDSILVDVATSFSSAEIKATSPNEFVSKPILMANEMLDKRLRLHPELKEPYLQIRARAQVEEAKVTPILLEYTTTTTQNVDFKRFMEISMGPAGAKLLAFITNKLFMHHTLNRFTMLKKEHFVMARSTLELAKKGKLEMVQQVYDKTLREVSSSFGDRKIYFINEVIEVLFKLLESNFEADSALNQAWRETQEYVSQRHEWDRGIWDLDLVPM